MKKHLLVFGAVFFFIARAGAQITIQPADLPTSGDKQAFISTASMKDTVDETLTGTNYSWDFSTLTPSANDTVRFEDPTKLSLIFFSYFGDVTQRLYGGTFTGSQGIFSNSKSAYSMLAVAFTVPILNQTIPLAFTKADVVYRYPLTYGNSPDSSFYEASYSKTISIKGKRVNSVDGWGKVTTPFGTFDCIRMKSIVQEVDSIGTNIKTERIEYKWLAKKQKMPVMEVIVTQAGPIKQKAIYYLDSARLIKSAIPLKVDFTANHTDVFVGDTVKLTNNTLDPLGVNTYGWSFSPNNISYVDSTGSSSKNVSVVFKDSGKYTVSLSAVIPFINISGDTTKTNYITVHSLTRPVADFYADRTHPSTSNVVNFIDASTNRPNQWTWIISPNTISWMNGTNNNSQNPQIKFDSAGKYTVTLVAANSAGSNSVTKTDYVTVITSGIEEYSPYSSLIKIYPNPSSTGLCHISTQALQTDRIHSLKISDVSGKVIFSEQDEFLFKNFDLDLTHFQKGIYFLKLTGDINLYLKRLVIQ